MSFKQLIAKVFKVTENQVTANIAKERMQIFLKEQRGSRTLKDDSLNKIKTEVVTVVAKYWNVNVGDVSFSIKKSQEKDDLDIFEMQITLPPNFTSTNPNNNQM